MIEIKTKAELDNLVQNNSGNLVVVKFSAEWCGPCKVLGRTISKIENEYNNVTFAEVDIEAADEEFVNENGVKSIPLLLFIKDGMIVEKSVGQLGEDKLKNKIQENLNK